MAENSYLFATILASGFRLNPLLRFCPPFMKECRCFSLRTGCFILGWLGIIFSIADAFKFAVRFVVHYPLFKNDVIKEMEKIPAYDNDTISFEAETTADVIAIVFYVKSAILALCYMFLLIGVYRKKTVLLNTFTVMISTFVVLSVYRVIWTVSTGRVMLYIWITFNIFNILVVYFYQGKLQLKAELMRAGIVHSDPPPRYEP